MGEIAFWLGPSAKNTKFSRKVRATNLVLRLVASDSEYGFPIKVTVTVTVLTLIH